jgi:hypothetical protein
MSEEYMIVMVTKLSSYFNNIIIGKLCGIDSGYEDYSYLYYPIPGIKYTTQTVCIKTCPVSPLAANLVGLYKTNSLFTNTVATANDPTVIASSLSLGGSLSGNFYMYDTLTCKSQTYFAKNKVYSC